MKYFIFIISVLLFFNVKAQDTLVYRNAGKLVVVLKEVSPTEVKYKRFDLQDGPMYTVNKTDIEKIIYKNGSVDSIAPPILKSIVVTEDAPVLISQRNKIYYIDTKKNYAYISNLIEQQPDQNKKPQLYAAWKIIEHNKQNEKTTRTVGILCGGLTLGSMFVYQIADASTSGPTPFNFIYPPVVLGACFVVFSALSIKCAINLKQKRYAFVNLYND